MADNIPSPDEDSESQVHREETGSKVKVGHKSHGLGGHGRFDTS